MRLRKIPEGQKIIRFINPWAIPGVIYFNKFPFLAIAAKSSRIIEAHHFVVAFSSDRFPAMQFYSNLKIEIEYR